MLNVNKNKRDWQRDENKKRRKRRLVGSGRSFMEIRTCKDRRSSQWTLMSFNYVLAGVHWTLADTNVHTTRYCTEYQRRSVLCVRTVVS